ncbi:hypothetical protein B0O99DRAFT_698512 [Bisporella sp. PMI_857]|nr:hypothetical protein B0O99DRAFT_698512 [Bisporella sp. PMI_857]
MALPLPDKYKKNVNEDAWGQPFDVSDDDNHTEKVVNGYIIHMQLYYQDTDYRDYRLWEYYREDFEGWTEELFDLADSRVRRSFRDYLRQYGVWIPKNNDPIPQTLYEVLQQQEYHEWTELETLQQLNVSKNFPSRWNPNSTEYHVPQLRNGSSAPVLPATKVTLTTPQPSAITTPRDSSQGRTLPQIPTPTTSTPLVTIPFTTASTPPIAIPLTTEPVTTANPLTKQLTDLVKLYDKDMRFSGELYDMMSVKLPIFFDNCSMVGLQPDQYHKALPIMLRERASKFYYTNFAGKGYTFDTMVHQLRVHFETEENRQLYMSEWRETTLRPSYHQESYQDSPRMPPAPL